MQDAADHAAIIHAILAAYVRRQMRLDPSPLLVVQPKQVASHDLCSPPAENHYPIQPSSVLLSFDPNMSFLGVRSQMKRTVGYPKPKLSPGAEIRLIRKPTALRKNDAVFT